MIICIAACIKLLDHLASYIVGINNLSRIIAEMMKELSITGQCTYPLSYHDKTDGDKEYKVDFKTPFHRIEYAKCNNCQCMVNPLLITNRIIPELKKHLNKELQHTKPNFEDTLDKICVENGIDCPEPRTSARMLKMVR